MALESSSRVKQRAHELGFELAGVAAPGPTLEAMFYPQWLEQGYHGEMAYLAGRRGELLLRGPNVMKGYLNRPDATAEAIVDGWFRTGDIAEIDADGWIYIKDRIKDVVIRGGENVHCSEVENAIYELDEVAEAAVFGVPDERYGEELMAWVKLRHETATTAEDIREFCRGRIAHYKIPRYVKFTQDFPMTVTGKIQKFRMRELAIEELGLQEPATIEHA